MKKHTVIHIDTAEFHNAVYILGREEKIYNWNQNVEFRKRLVGLLGGDCSSEAPEQHLRPPPDHHPDGSQRAHRRFG